MNVTIRDSLRLGLCLLGSSLLLALSGPSVSAHDASSSEASDPGSAQTTNLEELCAVSIANNEDAVEEEVCLDLEWSEQADQGSTTDAGDPEVTTQEANLEGQETVADESQTADNASAELEVTEVAPEAVIDLSICDQPTEAIAAICANDGGHYVYMAQPGDNLTLLARRSVQLHMGSLGHQIETAQVIAAETYIVQTMGAFELDINQEVEIEADLVARCSAKAISLSQDAIDRWDAYQPINEAIEEITPVSQPASTTPVVAPAQEVEQDTTVSQDDESKDSDDKDKDKDEDKGSSWYWWVLGIVIVLAIVIRLIAKRGKGPGDNNTPGNLQAEINPVIHPVKRKRGRPRKNT